MSNQVYANNMEVSCKQAAGKSICASPDVCMTPPQTPATPPGVPIPYPNTGMASDCTDGSSSVKISGQEVMLKNKSYFKKSTGDEAGCAPMKGVVTHKNMGKVYFKAWSMDVKAEGENVVRHLDITTHNHASEPPNPAPQVHTDAAATASTPMKEPCDHEYECKPIPREGQKEKGIDGAIADKRLGPNAGDPFEARAIEHNRAEIVDSADISPDFKCKKCPLRREVDHVTRDANGQITKIVQCKSDQSKLDPTKKGVIVTPKQLKETRKVAAAVTACQTASGTECKVQYKLEGGAAAGEAAKFLLKSQPPIVTMVP